MSDLLAKRNAIQADFNGHEFVSATGIGFEDYARMSTHVQKLESSRRYAVPAWALNDDQLVAVIARNMEGRVGVRIFKPGDNREKLRIAQQQLEAQRPALMARLDGMCARFVADTEKQEKYLGIQVEAVDTQLRLLSDTTKFLLGCVFYYWRLGYDSVETGAQLGMKPTHVRQTLARLLECAADLGFAPPEKIQPRHKGNVEPRQPKQPRNQPRPRCMFREAPRPAVDVQQVVAMRKQGMFTVDIVRALGLDKATGCEIVTRILVKAGLR